MSFVIGDKVRTTVARREVPAGSVGTVAACSMTGKDEVCVEFPAEVTTGRYFYRPLAGEVELVDKQFVNVVTSRTIWVTLPGDNESHKLTEDEARALFRQLEEVV